MGRKLCKYITFNYLGESKSGKTFVWEVLSIGGARLGEIRWRAQWRRYVFYPDSGTLFDAACLGELRVMLQAQMVAYGPEAEAAS